MYSLVPQMEQQMYLLIQIITIYFDEEIRLLDNSAINNINVDNLITLKTLIQAELTLHLMQQLICR